MAIQQLVINSSVGAAFQHWGLEVATDRGLEDAAQDLWRVWRQLLSREGTGDAQNAVLRTWDGHIGRVGQRPWHRPSKPGEPPARDTGELLGSIQIEKTADGYRIGSNLRKAFTLEYGAGPGFSSKSPGSSINGLVVILPRPHARPAAQLALPSMHGSMVGALRAARPIAIASIDILGLRRGLLAISANIGNLNALGIKIPFINGLRQKVLRVEKGLGDGSALFGGTFGQRLGSRIVGRQAGRFIGEMTSGLPSGFAKRVGNRTLSKFVTSPALRKLYRATR